MQNTPDSSNRLRVFLCHSKNDKTQVRTLYARLVEDGFYPWLDEENLLPGEDWKREIPRAVRNSDIVLVCLSKSSVDKTGYVQTEIRFALDIADEQAEGTIFIIPLRLEECNVPDRLKRWHWVNFFDDNGYEKLKKSLEHRANSLNIGITLADATPVDSSVKIESSKDSASKLDAGVVDTVLVSHLETANQKNRDTSSVSKTLERDPHKLSLALVMKGGGVKGLAYVGAIRELEKYYQFDWFIGTSAGAIAAVLLGAGYTTDELESLLGNKNFYDFLDAKWYKLPLNLLLKKGLYPADKFTVWIDRLLAKKLDCPLRVTLGQLPYRVTIYASRRDKNALVFDSNDLKTEDTAAAFAVRCSMSIPFIFTPQMDAGLRVLDGGMRNNYPVDALLRENPNTDFIGLYLGSEHFEGQESETSLIKDLFTIWTEAIDVESLKSHLKQTVIIDPRPISTVDFGLTDEEKKFLVNAGRVSALKFLLKQDKLSDVEKSDIKNEYSDLKKEVEQNRQVLADARQSRKNWIRISGLLSIIFFLTLVIVWNQSFVFYLFGDNKIVSTIIPTVQPSQTPSETPTPTIQPTTSISPSQNNSSSTSVNQPTPNPNETEKPTSKPKPTTTPNVASSRPQTPSPPLRRCEDLTYEEIRNSGNKKIPCVK